MEGMAYNPPRLPFELEREIFEIAAYQRGPRAFKRLLPMMLVARRVHLWIRPLLYSVMIKNSRASGTVNYPPSHRAGGGKQFPLYPLYGDHVRHLLLSSLDADEATRMLQSCPNTQNLAIWHADGPYDGLRASIKAMRIQKLSISVERLFQILPNSKDFALDPTIFTHLTHLDVTCMRSASWPDWQPLTQIPTLSHLTFGQFHAGIIKNILKESPQLELLIAIVDTEDLETLAKEMLETQALETDGRLVLLPSSDDDTADWEGGANGQQDFWVVGQKQKEERIPLRTQIHLIYPELTIDESWNIG